MKKNVIKKLYPNYSDKVQQYMLAVCNFLEEKFGNIDESWSISLDMLASNLDIFTRCGEQIQKDGLLIENRFGILEKNALIKVQNDAQIQALKILQEYGLTIKAMTKLKVDDDDENDDFLNDLMGNE